MLETQSERIIRKFGGVRRFKNSLKKFGVGVSIKGIYGWQRPIEDRGQNGMIPIKYMVIILKMARLDGIYLSVEDLDPRPRRITSKRIRIITSERIAPDD